MGCRHLSEVWRGQGPPAPTRAIAVRSHCDSRMVAEIKHIGTGKEADFRFVQIELGASVASMLVLQSLGSHPRGPLVRYGLSAAVVSATSCLGMRIRRSRRRPEGTMSGSSRQTTHQQHAHSPTHNAPVTKRKALRPTDEDGRGLCEAISRRGHRLEQELVYF